ncbi:hypothetical protein RA210_U210052 [Rubrivivax sp. A210]|nr:hypothetical protein RA210_U210052 [Rubrivivax sp. A210]
MPYEPDPHSWLVNTLLDQGFVDLKLGELAGQPRGHQRCRIRPPAAQLQGLGHQAAGIPGLAAVAPCLPRAAVIGRAWRRLAPGALGSGSWAMAPSPKLPMPGRRLRDIVRCLDHPGRRRRIPP